MLTLLTMDTLKNNKKHCSLSTKSKLSYESFQSKKEDGNCLLDPSFRYSSLRDRLQKECAAALRQRRKEIKAETGNHVLDSMNLVQLRARPDLGHDMSIRKKYHQRIQALASIEALMLTEQLKADRKEFRAARRQRRLEQRGALKTESREVGDMNIGTAENTDQHQNVRDHTGEEVDKILTLGSNMNSTNSGQGTQYSLDHFFERPVSIYDSTWNSSTEYNVPLKVWNLWSLDASVRAKFSNYAYFKGKLHVKIATTGTPYHYGRIMLSYQPYAKYNRNLEAYDELLSGINPLPADILPLYKCYLSQAPGCSYLDVKENKPIELEIPFISHKSKFRLFNDNDNVITNSTELVDFEEAGELRLVTLNPLRVANDDFDSDISINVYAWVTDIELGNITSTDMNITAQSLEIFTESSEMEHSSTSQSMIGLGKKMINSMDVDDEYNQPGPIANIASAVANAGNSLKDVPIIGSFARATSIVARGVKRVASLFGWSKPALISDPVFVKNLPFQNGAVTVGKDTIHKITLDPKQELSVDQSLGGMSSDQMTILEIANRESFLTTFVWSDTNVAMTDNLWKTLVTPHLFRYKTWSVSSPSPTKTTKLIQPTSLMFAAQPFASWRGKIKFRFEIVCSKFHRGKLLFKYDPNVAMNGLITTNSSKLNQQNTVILDIQDAQDIEFEVDWAHPRDWADYPVTDYDFPPFITDLNPLPDFDIFPTASSNGFLEVRPLNELVQPTSGSNVYINVYVSCSDLQVNRLSSLNMPITKTMTYTESKELTAETINETHSSVDDRLFLSHYGEKIVSFRQLLKRYVTVGVKVVSATQNVPGMWTTTGTLYPHNGLPINLNNSNPQTSTTNPRTLFSYLKYAYLGVRGGYRYRVILNSESNISNAHYTRVMLKEPALTIERRIDLTTKPLQSNTHPFDSSGSTYLSEVDGGLVYNHSTNGGIEFEIPFYNKNIFMFSFSDDYGFGTALETDIGYSTKCESWNWECAIAAKLATGDHGLVTVDACTAEDFTFLRYQGAPFYTKYVG